MRSEEILGAARFAVAPRPDPKFFNEIEAMQTAGSGRKLSVCFLASDGSEQTLQFTREFY